MLPALAAIRTPCFYCAFAGRMPIQAFVTQGWGLFCRPEVSCSLCWPDACIALYRPTSTTMDSFGFDKSDYCVVPGPSCMPRKSRWMGRRLHGPDCSHPALYYSLCYPPPAACSIKILHIPLPKLPLHHHRSSLLSITQYLLVQFCVCLTRLPFIHFELA